MFSRLRRRQDVGRRERLVELFNRMDSNGDRILHMNEVNEYLQRHRYDPSAIRVIFHIEFYITKFVIKHIICGFSFVN